MSFQSAEPPQANKEFSSSTSECVHVIRKFIPHASKLPSSFNHPSSVDESQFEVTNKNTSQNDNAAET